MFRTANATAIERRDESYSLSTLATIAEFGDCPQNRRLSSP